MPGTIRTKQKCPKCLGRFSSVLKFGLICPACKTTPSTYFVSVTWAGKQIRIYSDKTGRRLSSYQLARETLLIIQSEMRNHVFDPSKYVKSEQERFYFSCVARTWIEDKNKDIEQGLKALSYVEKLVHYNDNYFSFFKSKDIREIRRYDIDEFKNSLPGHLSPKTVKNIFGALKNLFHTALKKELIERMPSIPKIDAPEYNGWTWIDSIAQSKILEALPEIDRPIFAFLFLTGCRPGEARALKVKDLDVASKTIRIRRVISRGEIRETTKQKKQNIIPIHPELMPYFLDAIKTSLPEAFVFINKRSGGAYKDGRLREIWHRALKKAGMDTIRMYDATRHSFASQLVNANVSLNIISKLLGHSSIKMTQRYSHENVDTMRAAVGHISLSNVAVFDERKEKENGR